MNSIELDLYPIDFNVVSNKSCLGRILRTLVIVAFFIFFTYFSPFSSGISKLISFLLLFGGMFIADTYIRKLYNDWPKKKYFAGKITFESSKIIISNETVKHLLISDCKELVLFYDHYTGYSVNSRDLQMNGNALLFFKNCQNEVFVAKFNIRTEKSFNAFLSVIQDYKETLTYFKEYIPSDIDHILKPDLSGRIVYI